MKIREDIRKLTSSQTNLARALGLTQPRINQLIEEKVVIRDEQDPSGGVMIFDSVRNYYCSKKASDEGVDFWKEKAIHEKVKREINELKLEKERGEVYDAKEIEAAFIEMLATLRTHLTALPSKLAAQLEGKSREEIFDIINEEVESRLAELSDRSDYNGVDKNGVEKLH